VDRLHREGMRLVDNKVNRPATNAFAAERFPYEQLIYECIAALKFETETECQYNITD
jgi:hypothetical protein